MDIHRVPPFPITVTWDVPEADTGYVVYLEDLVDHSSENIPLISDDNSQIVYSLPREKTQYDSDYFVQIKDEDSGQTIYEDTLSVIRPYVNPKSLGQTASEIAEYKAYEIVARSIIDSYVGIGFYNRKLAIQKTGDGSDYFSLWDKVNRVLKAYENGILVYDADADPADNKHTYQVTADNSAIYRIYPEELVASPEQYNRAESQPIQIPRASGDLVHGGYRFVAFPKGYDYLFIADSGYKTIPSDVESATTMLVNDLKCGKLDYYQKYVTSYDTDQFKMEMDKKMLDGTGNLVVDKILDNYVVNITRLGVI